MLPTQPHAWTRISVAVDEDDAGGLEGGVEGIRGVGVWGACAAVEMGEGFPCDADGFGKRRL